MAAAMAALEAARKSAETNEAKMRVAEKQMRAAFDAIDEDHSGELDTNEILKALERIGEYSSTSPNRHKVLRWVNRAVGTDGSIGFEEYKKLIERMRLEKNKWKVPVPGGGRLLYAIHTAHRDHPSERGRDGAAGQFPE